MIYGVIAFVFTLPALLFLILGLSEKDFGKQCVFFCYFSLFGLIAALSADWAQV